MDFPITRTSGVCRTGLGLASAALALAFLAAPAEPASAAPSKSTTTTSPGWSVTLKVKKATVQAGHTVAATLIVTDETDRRVRFDSCAANGVFDIVLENRRIPQSTLTGAVACWTAVHPGRNVFYTKVSTDYETCGSGVGRSCPAPLPAGVYATVINWPKFSAHVPNPGELTLKLTG